MEIRWPSRRQWGRIFGRYRVGAKVLMALGGVQTFVRFCVWILDQKSRVEEAMLTVGQLGEVARVLFRAAISPWFGVGLIFLGVLYLVFVPAEEHPAETYPAFGVRVANVIAWITVGSCVLLLWGALVAGYVAVHLPKQTEQVPLKPLRISQEEKMAMAEELKTAGSFPLEVTRLTDSDSSYVADLLWILKKAGWKPGGIVLQVWDEPMVGLYILVPESDKIPVEGILFVPGSGLIPEGAEVLAGVLDKHHIGFNIQTNKGQAPGTFALLIGSRP